MERSAVRLLKNIFRCGLFENPYLDPAESEAVVGCEAFAKAGYEAQLRSVVLVKNHSVLPAACGKKVYIPDRTIQPHKNFFRGMSPETAVHPVERSLAEQYFQWADTPEEADLAIVFIESPITDGGYSGEEAAAGGNGYLPITLQYRPYQANTARQPSIAGGDFPGGLHRPELPGQDRHCRQ